jgi:T-complex protein 1 subunit theta
LGAPTEEEIGTADEVYVTEIGSQKVTIFKRDSEDCRLATLILRGSTNNLMDDIERAVDDAVNTFKCLLKDTRFVAGAGAIETYLGIKLE